VARIEYSMGGAHEGVPHGIPTSWSWATTPQVIDPTDVNGDTSITAWGLVYADASATEPAEGTVRIELKNMESYVHSRSQDRWLRAQGTEQVDGGHFLEDLAGNAATTPDWRTEPDGGISTAMVPGYNLHFWPTGSRGSVTPGDIDAVYTTYQARLIGPGAGTARYLAMSAADWWLTPTAPYPNNSAAGMGRFMYLSTSWQAFDFYTGGGYGPASYPPAWTAAQVAASAPPIDAMGQP
jgi:hypothetical protein